MHENKDSPTFNLSLQIVSKYFGIIWSEESLLFSVSIILYHVVFAQFFFHKTILKVFFCKETYLTDGEIHKIWHLG